MNNNENLNLSGKKATPCSDRALKLAEATLKLRETHDNLEEAKRNVPAYMAHYSDEDYYQDEQQAYYDACANLEAIIFPSES